MSVCNNQRLANVLHFYPLFKLKEQEEICASFQHGTNSCETLTDMTCMHDKILTVLLNKGKTSLNTDSYNDNERICHMGLLQVSQMETNIPNL